MLLTIHNLPTHIEYNDIRDLIVSKCGLRDAILDNLQPEGVGMRVTVGVVEEEDAAILVRKMNGIFYRGQQLYVEDKRQKKDAEQPYHTSASQQAQYNMMGYNYSSQNQTPIPGMYTQPVNYAAYLPQATGQTVENAFMQFGGQQPQLWYGSGNLSDFNQQLQLPLAQQNVQPPDPYSRRSASGERGAGQREETRGARGDHQRRQAPSNIDPWAGNPPTQTNYRNFNAQIKERSGQTREFDQNVYEKRDSRPNDNKRGYNARDSYSGPSSNQRDMRGGHSSNQRDMRGGHSSNQRDMRGGHSSNQRDMRGGHSSNQRDMRGGYLSNQRDMRGGHSSNQRDERGGHLSNQRDLRGSHSSNQQDMRGGHSSNQRDMRGGHSSNQRDMRGGHSSNQRDMRGGHSFNQRDMRGGHSLNQRDRRGGHSSNMRGGHSSNDNMDGGHFSSSHDMRGGYTSNVRGGHTNMRGGHTSNRGGHANMRGANSSNTRGGHGPNSRGSARDTQNDNPKFAKKRRWDDQSEHPQPTGRDAQEPQAKKPAPFPEQPAISAKTLKLARVKGVGKLIFYLAAKLNMRMTDGPSPMKSALRKELISRVSDLTGGELLSPDEIYERYRARYPESDDTILHNDLLKQISEGAFAKAVNLENPPAPIINKPIPEVNKVNAAPPPLHPVTQFKQKKKALKKSMRPVSPGKIPSYPQGNKKIHSQQKQQQKQEMTTLDAYEVDANLQKAMEEEAELIGAILEEALKTPETDIEKIVYKKVDQEALIDRCKKLICYHVSKRISNSGVKMVRIYGRPHPPRRPVLEQYLAPYGCLALKKSVKAPFFTATFSSYDTIDKLCEMGPVPIGDQDIMITFKQMSMAPQKEKLDHKRAKLLRKQQAESLIEDSKVNLLDKDWQAVEEEERKAKANENSKAEAKKEMDVDEVPNITESFEDEEMFIQKEEADFTADDIDFTEDNHDFLNVDFQVIDEVKGSDNDDPANDCKKLEDNVENIKKDNWDDDGENYENKGNENEGYADDDEGNTDENKGGDNGNNEIVGEGDDENDYHDDGDNKNDEDKPQNMGDVNIEDVHLADVNEDDLEDY